MTDRRHKLCARGHDMADAYVTPDGGRRACRVCERLRHRRARIRIRRGKDAGRGEGFSLVNLARRDWDVPRPPKRIRRVCAVHHTELRESINPDRMQCDTCGNVVDFDVVDDAGNVVADVRHPDARQLKDGTWKLTSKGKRVKAQRRKK